MSSCQPRSLMEPVWPLAVVYEPEKLIVPKLVSGSTLQKMNEHCTGASATHSAEVPTPDVEVCVVVNVPPVLKFVIVRVNAGPDAETAAEIALPWLIGSCSRTGGFGYISYHA